ncbi:MAG: zinc-dependent metalloprotease [Prevotella sp.]|nr:zinc-dependent metalloprotease [Prevotella sp.]
MKKIIAIIFCFIFVTSFSSASTEYILKKKTKSSASKNKVEKKKDGYAKLFKEKKKLTSCKTNDVGLFLYDDKLYMELPLSNMGREFLISSVISSSSSLLLNGKNANQPLCVVIDKIDTLAVLKAPRGIYAVDTGERDLQNGVEGSHSEPIIAVFPIKAWNADSTKFVFDVTSFFKSSDKRIFDVTNEPYGDGLSISSVSVKSENEFFEDIVAYDKCVCVNKTFSGELTLRMMLGEISDKPFCQFNLQTLITLLPESANMMKPREANGNVGTGYVRFEDFRNVADVKKGYYVTRRRYQKGDDITFYVDTIMSESWRNAVAKAAEGWNDAFEHQNLGRPIKLLPYLADSSFNSGDPLKNIISFANNMEQSVTTRNIIDPRTGEILSSRIRIPRNLVNDVRRNGITKMAEVDERYRTYYIPDDLLCEILQARVLTAFGRSLGLSTNLSGSAAYSPEQLRSPEFTQKYGITASVMDGMIYNYLAMPGDKERGVVLTFNKPGICDEFVLKYLYTPVYNEDIATLKSWVLEQAGDARYKYGKKTLLLAKDPSSLEIDMGNDPIEASRSLRHHLRYVAQNASTWFDIDHLPTDFNNLFPEFIVREIINHLQDYLRMYVGGVYQSDWNHGSLLPVTNPVSKKLQHDVVMEMLMGFDDLSWVDANADFIRMHGVTNDVDAWGIINQLSLRILFTRLKNMNISVDHSENPYTQENLLDDIEDFVFASVKSKKPISHKEIMKMWNYSTLLINASDELTAISNAKKQKGNNSFVNLSEDDVFYNEKGVEPTTQLEYYHSIDLSPILYKRLQRAKNLLMKAKMLSSNENDKNKVQFVIMIADRVLNNQITNN